jgi:UDP-N-acetylmuramoylalanine--D-glutamate ligase
MMNLRGKRALVMGLGVHDGGLGVARFLVGQGADVTVTDLRGPDLLKPSLDALAGLPIRYVLGEHHEADFRNADLVVRNPAVPRESPYLQIARAAGAAIEMEMTLFFRLCPGPILGITGTKGKTTTTLLAGAMLRAQYPHTVVAGNLRVSALEALPRITAGTPVVLELSSWQLEGLGEAQLSPQYACVTNISPDHLDRYGSMEAYVEAKEQIFLHQNANGVAIRNLEDRIVAHMAEHAPGREVWFTSTDIEAHDSPMFTNSPAAFWRADQLIWRRPGSPEEYLCYGSDVNLAGSHNRANVAAAAALAKSFGVKTEQIRSALRAFTGVEHRLELAHELDGVRFINDTAATAPEAAIAALRSFDAPIVLICGGADKALPFDALARAIVARTKAVVLLKGTATPKLAQELEIAMQHIETARSVEIGRGGFVNTTHTPSITGPFDDFEAAISVAHAQAAPGDVVLLSPGCASFGMFRNEFHRGDEFRRIVNAISRSEPM